jgi:hypothetical protein
MGMEEEKVSQEWMDRVITLVQDGRASKERIREMAKKQLSEEDGVFADFLVFNSSPSTLAHLKHVHRKRAAEWGEYIFGLERELREQLGPRHHRQRLWIGYYEAKERPWVITINTTDSRRVRLLEVDGVNLPQAVNGARERIPAIGQALSDAGYV